MVGVRLPRDLGLDVPLDDGDASLPVESGEERLDLALVDLAEGVRMMTNVVDCEFDAIEMGMPLTVVFTPISDDVTIVQFRPAD